MKKILSLILLLFLQIKPLDNLEQIEKNIYKGSLKIEASQQDPIIEDSIKLTSNNPDLEIISTNINTEPIITQNAILKDLKILNKDFEIEVQFKTKEFPIKGDLHLVYQSAKSKEITEKFIKVNLSEEQKTKKSEQNKIEKEVNLKSNKEKTQSEKKDIWFYLEKFAKWVQNLLKTSESIWIQLIAVFFLGILMSLTPCIYPMIPITAGILQSYGSKSLLHNFTVSTLYGLGIATTFSIFGLIAAFTGHLFGNLLTNPIFVIFMVLIMGYMGLSMLGAFEMYIPRFMQNNNSGPKKASGLKGLISAFLMGVISGSVASPCLTPGLAFLLTLVASTASKFLGFVLLFTAGLGLSLPLLIIGTFSSSLNVLPRAGYWMIEVKKVFGFILFGMCFYFLDKIIPFNYLLALISLFCMAMGIFYFYSINKKADSSKMKIYKNIMGAIFIIISILTLVKAVQETMFPNEQNNTNFTSWHKDLDSALNESKMMDHNLLVDVGGEFCSICKAIDKKIFENESVKEALKKFVTLKINASSQKEEYEFFKEKFNVIGVPTILLLTPELELVKSWGSELYNKSPEQFIEELD